MHYQIAELLFERQLSLSIEIAVSCSNAPLAFFFSVKLETYSAAAKLMTDHRSDVNNFVSCSSVLVSSTQRNIVLPCKLRIPESKLLCELPLCGVSVIQIPTLWCFSHSKPAVQKNPALAALVALIQMTCNQAQNACD